jgi:NitT/TauT family transport system substrate-binding protein
MKLTFWMAGVGAMAFAAAGIINEAHAQGTAPAHTGARTAVKLGVSGRPDQAHLELALRRGYFARQGIDVETVPAASGNDFIAPLAMNQLQVASGSPNASLFNALNRGIDIRIVGDFAHLEGKDDGLVSIVARSDLLDSGAIKSIADLKGKTVTLGTGRGQVSYIVMNSVLEKAKLNWSDIKLLNLPFGEAINAFRNKAVDAGFMIEPLIAAAQGQNVARILVRGGEVDSGAHLSILLFSPEFAKQTDVATRFMIAYLQGARDYRDAFHLKKDQDAAIEILVKHLPVKDPAVWKAAFPQYTNVNGEVNAADIKRQAETYRKLGDVSGPMPDIDKYIDRRFAEGAVKVLGRQ